MWLFFRNDDLGLAPEKFSRLLALFDHYNHKLNAAVRPDLVAQAKASLPAGEAKDYLQIVAHGGDAAELAKSFTNFFPCYVGEGPAEGFLMTSAEKAGSLPNFGTFLDFNSDKRLSSREIFRTLSARHPTEEFSGVRLRHSEMTEEDFVTLEELLHNLYKRSIPTSFFSDFIPGFERYSDADSGHV
jgi:hypothetical protein